MSINRRLRIRRVVAATAAVPGLLAVVAPGSCAWAQRAEVGGDAISARGGVAVHHLKVRQAQLGGDVRIRERQTGLLAWSPASDFDRFTFQAGADYAYTRYAFEGLPTRPRDLHHLHVPLRWHDRDGRWLAVVMPVIATSSNVFKDFLDRGSRDDVDLHLRLETRHWSRPDMGWKIALVRDAALGSPRVYPAAALLWKGRRVQAELGLPASRIDWQAQDRLTVGAALFPAGGSWHVVSDERGGAQFDFRARAWRAALMANWQPWRWLRASAQTGLEFHRRYEFEDDTGASIRRNAGSAGYFRLEVRFEFGI